MSHFHGRGGRIGVVFGILKLYLESNIFCGEFIGVIYQLVLDSDNIMFLVYLLANFVRIVLKKTCICSLGVTRLISVGGQQVCPLL